MCPASNESEVYEPEEDSYLLLKAAIAEARDSDSVLEIGCGRGPISKGLAPLVREILATDINPSAVRIVMKYGIQTIRADLFRGIIGRFDLIVFNPPYLPTSEEEKTLGWLNYALDGGKTGRDTIKRFLEDLEAHLTSEGRALILLSSLTGITSVEKMAVDLDFEVFKVEEEKLFFEQLYVFKLVKSNMTTSIDITHQLT